MDILIFGNPNFAALRRGFILIKCSFRPRFLPFIVLFLLFLPAWAASAEKAPALQAAFVRDESLWLKTGDKEEKLAHSKQGETFSDLVWSADGKQLAYKRHAENGQDPNGSVWIYNAETSGSKQVYAGDASNLQWAPAESLLAFQDASILNVVDASGDVPKPFGNVTGGVGNYAWEPGGKSFLVSMSARLTPGGWSDVQLYKVPLDANFDPGKATLFFTLRNAPSGSLFAVGTSTFKWSADGRWIAFIAVPTASLSMDANTLCTLSSDGRTFRKVDEMLDFPEWFGWSPHSGKLAYIGGPGRFYAPPKQLKLFDPAAPGQTATLTPKGKLDIGFAWLDKPELIVSRAKAAGGSASQFHYPFPALVRQSAAAPGDSRSITMPSKRHGDSNPLYMPGSGKLVWLRTNGSGSGNLWSADANGKSQQQWIIGIQGAYAVHVQ